MKAKILRNALITAVLCSSAALPALAANVSISVHQLGVYGRITLGGPVPQADWPRHCACYNACSQPVIFVRDSWVRERHTAYYRDRDGDGVPNRYDRDRDGDGKRNSRDRRPNNPYVR